MPERLAPVWAHAGNAPTVSHKSSTTRNRSVLRIFPPKVIDCLENQKCTSNMFMVSNAIQFYALTLRSRLYLREELGVLTASCVDGTIAFPCRGTANPDGRRKSC